MQGSKLYVGNIPYTVTSRQLEELFGTYGEVKETRVIEGKGFAFVEMTTSEAAQKAKDALDGTELEGRTIKVDEARPPREREKRGNYQSGGYKRY